MRMAGSRMDVVTRGGPFREEADDTASRPACFRPRALRGRRLASEKLAAEAAPTRSNAAPSAGGDLDPGITDLDPLPGAYLAGLAQLDLAVNEHHAAGDQRLAGTAAVANPHQLEQLVEFDEVAVELEVELVHRSEEHTSELQSLMRISYAVFCL